MKGNPIEIKVVPRRAVLVGIVSPEESVDQLSQSLDELVRLLDTLGIESVDRLVQYKDSRCPRYRIGTGKLEELRALVKATEADLVVFDSELSPSQNRNLEKQLGVEIADRCGVILWIFSQNAKTHEAKLQVELANLEYSLSRLTRKWSHLSRQQGGMGFIGGEGETQLEVDRRICREQIQKVKGKLQKIAQQRKIQKKGRDSYFGVAIVGYTNCGKSTLLNRLTSSNVLVQDKLFATLDPSVRMSKAEEKPAILFSDTVGFIRKLPHHLVASFRSTFDEIRDADLLLHVVDISDEDYKQKISETLRVLEDLELDKIPRMLVFNKIDLKEMEPTKLKLIRSVYAGSVLISAAKNIGFDDFKKKLYDFFADRITEKKVVMRVGSERILQQIYDLTRVFQVDYSEDAISVHFRGATKDVDYILDLLEHEKKLVSAETVQQNLGS